jgi:deoxyribonuclease-4
MPARVGFHVSIAGRLPDAVGRALERGCTAFQSFCGNPRGWSFQERSAGEVEAFRSARAEADLSPYFVHACYLVNVCAADRAIFQRSIRRLADELKLAALLGADGYVLHPGSHKGRSLDWGVKRAASAIEKSIEGAGSAPPLLLEHMALPHGPGGDFATLGELLRSLAEAVPTGEFGLALDSCHVFGAGYDLRSRDEVDRLMQDVTRQAGIERLRLLHVNDARDAPGSRRDRHEHIGKGTIGNAGLRNLLGHPAVGGLPLILETPWEGVETDRRNLRALRRLLP